MMTMNQAIGNVLERHLTASKVTGYDREVATQYIHCCQRQQQKKLTVCALWHNCQRLQLRPSTVLKEIIEEYNNGNTLQE